MTKISQLSGIGAVKHVDLGTGDLGAMSDAEMTLRIEKSYLQAKQASANGARGRVTGIGNAYQRQIDTIDKMLNVVTAPVTAEQKIAALNGIGKTIVGKLLQKVATGVKKAATTVAKVVTAPGRLIIKGILEVSLPKAAPGFLYLFINDAQLLAKMPAAVQRKRKKLENVSKFITNVIGMKQEHYLGILRTGIVKKYKKEPEAVILELAKAKGIAGIGVIELAAVSGLISLITEIINKIKALFGKKDDVSVSADDMPTADDWAPDGGVASDETVQAAVSLKKAKGVDDDNPAPRGWCNW